MDHKGRTSVPRRFRAVFAQDVAPPGQDVQGEALEAELVITRSLEPCLVAFSQARWLEFEAVVEGLNPFGRKGRLLRRAFVAHAEECALDRQGRVLIPAHLRDYAGLEDSVVWVGALGHCELWSPARWRQNLEDTLQDEELLEEALEALPF